MPRKHKEFCQKPVSGIGKELSGAQKRKRQLEIEQQNKVLRLQAAKHFGFNVQSSEKKDLPLAKVDESESKPVEINDDNNNNDNIFGNNEGTDSLIETVESIDPADDETIDKNDKLSDDDTDSPIDISTSKTESTINLLDPSTWPLDMTDAMRTEILSTELNVKADSQMPTGLCRFLRNYLTGVKINGETFRRDWIRISEANGSVYCMPCCIFSKVNNSPWISYGQTGKGFHDFHNSLRSVSMHEESLNHLESCRKWRSFLKLRKTDKSLSSLLSKQNDENVNEWKLILRGILDVILFLAQHNLAFLGDSKNLMDRNCGNFLGLIKMLSKYYPPLAKHLEALKYRKVSYLSPRIQNEFIIMCGNEVRNQILDQIRSRKYYSIMFDSTPDTSRTDQLSQIIRSVECNENKCCIHENFLGFISTAEKTGAGLSEVILEALKADNLNLNDCKGQGYDNGSNMSGIYSGVQAKIIEQNAEAKFLPCAAHSLNLVGTNAAEKIRAAKLLLGEIQNLFLFFAGSTSRWAVLKSKCKVSLKCQSATRWSSKASAVNALWEQYSSIVESLVEISNSDKFSAEVAASANSRLNDMLTYRFLLGTCIWNRILFQINSCNIMLQNKDIDVSRAAKRLKVLCEWLDTFKKEGFEICLELSRKIADENGVSLTSGFENVRRGRGINPRYDDPTVVTTVRSQSNFDRFRCEFFDKLMDNLISEMKRRFQKLSEISSDFNFLWGAGLSISASDKEKCVKDLSLQYPNDLNGSAFLNEVQTLEFTVKEFIDDPERIGKTGPLDILNLLYANGLFSTYPNCETALRIFLCLPVSVASNERAFSKLKLIKNYLRSSMGQERLNGLAIISIERDIASEIDFDKIISKFALQKSRKINLD